MTIPEPAPDSEALRLADETRKATGVGFTYTLAHQLAGHVRRLLAELEAERAKVAALSSRIVPGRFYACGCPVLSVVKIKAFCDTHCKPIRDEVPA